MMTCCVIIHNMIEDEDEGVCNVDFDYMGNPVSLAQHEATDFEFFLEMHRRVRS